jgi:putative tryptophan/tyrosine transport system substrate-binding protein
MRRRDFLALIGGTAAAMPRVAGAQQPALPVIGFLFDTTPEAWAPRITGFRRGLSDAGFVDGRNVIIALRWAGGNYDLLPDLAADLVRRQVSVIVTSGSERVTQTAKAATSTIPIVAAVAGDPVKRGLVASVSRPGGNVTVVSLFTSSNNALVAKRVELVRELLPKAAVVGWFADSNILDYDDQLHDLQRAARAFGLEATIAPVARESDLEASFTSLIRQGAGAILETGPLVYTHRGLVVALAARQRVAMLYEWRDFVAEGGLMSYGTDLAEVFRQAGVYAGRILKGERAGDLPVVQPTKFDLVINLKTANTLGLSIPPSLLARADEVIE